MTQCLIYVFLDSQWYYGAIVHWNFVRRTMVFFYCRYMIEKERIVPKLKKLKRIYLHIPRHNYSFCNIPRINAENNFPSLPLPIFLFSQLINPSVVIKSDALLSNPTLSPNPIILY